MVVVVVVVERPKGFCGEVVVVLLRGWCGAIVCGVVVVWGRCEEAGEVGRSMQNSHASGHSLLSDTSLGLADRLQHLQDIE